MNWAEVRSLRGASFGGGGDGGAVWAGLGRFGERLWQKDILIPTSFGTPVPL